MKKIKIIWKDAVIYGAHSKIPEDVSYMETVGFLEKEDHCWMVIRDPYTNNMKTGDMHPKNAQPTFYCIPKKAIKEIKEIE